MFCVFRKIKGWVIFEYSLRLFRKKRSLRAANAAEMFFAVPKGRQTPFRRILFIKSAERLIFLHFAAYYHSFFGLLHCLAQGVAVDYVELNMIVAQCFKGAEVVYAKVAAEMLLHIIYLKFYNKDLYDTRFYRLNFEMANKLMAASSIEEVESISDEAFRSIFLFFNVEGNHGERKTISPLIIKYLEENYKNEIKISNIEKITYMTSAYASRLFKKETSLTIKTCLINIRMKHAQELLLNTDMPIKDIAAEVGYTDIRGFYKMFSQHFGITCSEMRENRVEVVKQP